MGYVVTAPAKVQKFQQITTNNPILPWNFQNCYLEEDRNECVKPVKKSAAQKIDGAICALMCIKLLNEMQISGK